MYTTVYTVLYVLVYLKNIPVAAAPIITFVGSIRSPVQTISVRATNSSQSLFRQTISKPSPIYICVLYGEAFVISSNYAEVDSFCPHGLCAISFFGIHRSGACSFIRQQIKSVTWSVAKDTRSSSALKENPSIAAKKKD